MPKDIPSIDTITVKKVIKYFQYHLILPSNYEKFVSKLSKKSSRDRGRSTRSHKSLGPRSSFHSQFSTETRQDQNRNSFINNLHSDASVRNGSFLFNLINKMEKKVVLKGKSVKNGTSIKSNFKKIFGYLKRFEKFNQRFLVHGAEYYLVNSHFDFFWGFMADLHYFYKGLVSKFDAKYKPSKKSTKFLNSGDSRQLKAVDDALNKVQRLDNLINV